MTEEGRKKDAGESGEWIVGSGEGRVGSGKCGVGSKGTRDQSEERYE